jgi:hypothetical protein
MKNLLKSLLCFSVIIILSSCGDDATSPAINDPQNEGPVQTQEGTPVGMPVMSSIGSAGGNLMAEDSTIMLEIPPGALNANINIILQPVTNMCPGASGELAYRFSPVQFNDSVTLTFKYGEDADGRFLAAAMQNSGGYWKIIRSAIIDTVNRTMKVKVKSIGAQTDGMRAGGGDIAGWEYIKMLPGQHFMRVNETVNLIVRNTAPNEDEELQYLPPTVTSWSKDGAGTLAPNNSSAIYTAPGTMPQPNTVKVYALANYGGSTVQVQSDIKIIGNVIRYHVKLNLSKEIGAFAGYPCVLTDGADMDVTVSMGNPPSVSVENIIDRVPIVTPPDYQIPNNGGTITWLPDAYGLMNISSIIGFVTGLVNADVALNVIHDNTQLPKFHVVPTQGNSYYLGGNPTPGLPPTVIFHNNGQPQTFIDLTNDVTVIVTPVE